MKPSIRARRRTFAHQLTTAGIQLGTNNNLLVRITEHEVDILTDKEKAYIEKLKTRLHQEGIILIELANRIRSVQ
jgi:hypothetical protein